MTDYPTSLPLSEKTTWTYDDCFPKELPFRLTSIFLHKNYAMDMHCHDFYEINVTIKGNGIHYANGQYKEISVGDVVIIPPETYHGYHNINDLDVFHALIHKNFFFKYINDFNLLPSFKLLFNQNLNSCVSFHLDNDVYSEILAILYKLDRLEVLSNTNPDRTNYLLIYADSYELIIRLCKEYSLRFSQNNGNVTDSGVYLAVEYIHANYASKITLNELCAVSLMSKTLFGKQFKQYFDVSPIDYLNHYRIMVAKNLIIESNKSITQIAQEVGFFDVSHFLKYYKKYENESPTKLRKKLNA